MTSAEIVPPPGLEVYEHLPEPLRVTLFDSYQARVTDVPESYKRGGGNLDNLWWGRVPPTYWTAVEWISDADVKMMAIIWERANAISPAIWQNVQWIRNFWVGSSAGFKCRYRDRTLMRSIYESSARVCKDSETGGRDHPGCDTWREISDAKWGLHLLIGRADSWIDEIHLDWVDPATKSNTNQVCSYFDWGRPLETPMHLVQVFANINVERSPFLFPDTVSAARQHLNLVRVQPGFARYADATEVELAALETTWLTGHRQWACQGQRGWNHANVPFVRADEIKESLKSILMKPRGQKF